MMFRQRGMTTFGWLLTFALGGFFITVGLKLLPVYIDSLKIDSVLSSLQQDPVVRGGSYPDIVERIMKQFRIETITNINREDIYISNSPEGLQIEIEYEVRKGLVGNLDLVAHFKKVEKIATH